VPICWAVMKGSAARARNAVATVRAIVLWDDSWRPLLEDPRTAFILELK
jgi:hypothetical protein